MCFDDIVADVSEMPELMANQSDYSFYGVQFWTYVMRRVITNHDNLRPLAVDVDDLFMDELSVLRLDATTMRNALEALEDTIPAQPVPILNSDDDVFDLDLQWRIYMLVWFWLSSTNIVPMYQYSHCSQRCGF